MKPGCHHIPENEYHADPCPVPSLSRSTIKDILDCPLKAWMNHPRLNPRYQPKQRAIFDIGHIAHSLFIEGIDKAVSINAEDWRKNATKGEADEARKAGKIPLLKAQYEGVRIMAEEANRQLAASELGIQSIHEEGDSELSYIWKERDVWMRVRPDWIRKDRKLILDYKTTSSSARPEEYARIITSTALEIQDSFYRRGVYNIERVLPDFVFMVQEVSSPYLCTFIKLDTLFKEMGEQKVTRGIRLWESCLKSDIWPGYSKKVCTVEPKPWALASWEMQMQG
mgnify:CR=1 FL=1